VEHVTILLYRRAADPLGKRLERKIEAALLPGSWRPCGALPEFLLELRDADKRNTVVVLLAENQEELARLLVFRDVLAEYRCILILPDASPETISKGHSLYPRFLADIENNLDDVVAVLAKMADLIGNVGLEVEAPHAAPEAKTARNGLRQG